MRAASANLSFFLVLSVLCAPGCGAGNAPGHPGPAAPDMAAPPEGGATADLMPPPPPYESPFPPDLPQVEKGSGAVLAAPVVVPVFFPGDALQSPIVAFLRAFTNNSPSWQVLGEYGVGAATVNNPVVLSQSLPSKMADSDVQRLLSGAIANHGLPAVGPGTVYVLFMPESVTVNFGGAVSCQDFGGYHNWGPAPLGAAYVVLPRCSRESTAEITGDLSHELAEAATDPQINTNNTLDPPFGLWQFPLFGNEIGDMCQNLGDALVNVPGVGVVSRLWSNAAARMRQNPCLPAPQGPAFFAVPILTEEPRVTIGASEQLIETVAVAPGQTVTLAVRLYSPADPGPAFSVTAAEMPLADNTGAPVDQELTLAWQEAPGNDTAPGQAGGVLHLQITPDTTSSHAFTTLLFTATGPTASGGKTQTQWVAGVRVTGL